MQVNYMDLEMAFDFVSAEPYEHEAYICSETGQIYWNIEGDDLPDDIETNDRYLTIPSKHDLDLGNALVRRFAHEHLPNDVNKIADMFRAKGAYSRYKDFLDQQDQMQEWYVFEQSATNDALKSWCEDNGLTVSSE